MKFDMKFDREGNWLERKKKMSLFFSFFPLFIHVGLFVCQLFPFLACLPTMTS